MLLPANGNLLFFTMKITRFIKKNVFLYKLNIKKNLKHLQNADNNILKLQVYLNVQYNVLIYLQVSTKP